METQLNQQELANIRQNQQRKGVSEQMIEEWIKIQLDLNNQIELKPFDISTIRYVAGCDVGYSEDSNGTVGHCSIVIMDLKDGLRIAKKYRHEEKVDSPYVQGFHAFRELPLILKTAQKIKEELKPDLYFFDGNGLLHERKMGLATHAAIMLKTPSIGVSKVYYKFDNVDFVMPEDKQGSVSPIIHNGEVIAVAMRTKEGSEPLFISCGNYITLEICQTLVMKFTKPNTSKIPTPLRLAEIEVRRLKEKAKIIAKKKAKQVNNNT